MKFEVSVAPRRGRPPGHRLDDVLSAAVEIVDAQGLERLSMALVSSRLGMSRMGVYRYVADRADLEARLPRFLLTSTMAKMMSSTVGLNALRELSDGLQATLGLHSALAPVFARPTVGPELAEASEHCVALLVADGASCPEEAFQMVRAVVAQVIGEFTTSHGGAGNFGVELVLDGVRRRLGEPPAGESA